MSKITLKRDFLDLPPEIHYLVFDAIVVDQKPFRAVLSLHDAGPERQSGPVHNLGKSLQSVTSTSHFFRDQGFNALNRKSLTTLDISKFQHELSHLSREIFDRQSGRDTSFYRHMSRLVLNSLEQSRLHDWRQVPPDLVQLDFSEIRWTGHYKNDLQNALDMVLPNSNDWFVKDIRDEEFQAYMKGGISEALRQQPRFLEERYKVDRRHICDLTLT